MIEWRSWEAAPVNRLLGEWGHYLDAQTGPRMVRWFALFMRHVPVAVAVSASPRGSRCAGVPWQRVVELARLCSHPDHRDMTRVALRCWRVTAAEDWANAYDKEIEMLAAYSDSSRHPGSIYRTDGWTLYDEKPRGGGGQKDRKGGNGVVTLKRLWVWRLPTVVRSTQLRLAVGGAE